MGLSIAPRLISPRMAGAIASLAVMTSVPSIGFAAGTEAQREACMSDAFRLCSMAMPDEKRVENCLRAAGPRLSRACYDVFNPPQAAAPNQITRGQAPMRAEPSAPARTQAPSMQQMPPGSAYDDE
jgi:hypothetical protein